MWGLELQQQRGEGGLHTLTLLLFQIKHSYSIHL